MWNEGLRTGSVPWLPLGVVVVQSLSQCLTLCDPMVCSMPDSPVLHYLLEFDLSIESVMLPNHLILCHTLLVLPSIFPSIRVFANELVMYRVTHVLVQNF